MRSRYSAYVLHLEDYLLRTWHPDTRPTSLDLTAEPPLKWTGLVVKQFEQTSPTTATVAFEAHYKVNGKAELMRELSQFVLLDRWYYLAGTHN
jgi:SEC-C motif domain protein